MQRSGRKRTAVSVVPAAPAIPRASVVPAAPTIPTAFAIPIISTATVRLPMPVSDVAQAIYDSIRVEREERDQLSEENASLKARLTELEAERREADAMLALF